MTVNYVYNYLLFGFERSNLILFLRIEKGAKIVFVKRKVICERFGASKTQSSFRKEKCLSFLRRGTIIKIHIRQNIRLTTNMFQIQCSISYSIKNFNVKNIGLKSCSR